MAIFYGSLGMGFLAGAFTLFIADFGIYTLFSFVISIYFWIEAGRWAYWKDIHYINPDGISTKEPPVNLFCKLLKKINPFGS